MAEHVFVSFSSKDDPAANAICAALTRAGITCWRAPGDIPPGVDWGDAIIAAIAANELMVLVLSSQSNASPQVKREVDRAVHHHKPILTVRIEEFNPTGAMEFYLATTHWLDAFDRTLDEHLPDVVAAVRALPEMVGTFAELAARSTRPHESVFTVQRGTQAVAAALNQLASVSPASAADVGKVFDTAIEFGAPIYNQGSPDGCARIYLETAQGVLSILHQPDEPPDALTTTHAGPVLIALDKVVAEFGALTAANADSLAWALRREFDHFHAARGMEDVDWLLDEIRRSRSELKFEAVGLVLSVAIACGNILYRAQDLRGCAELHLHTSRGILSLLADAVGDNGSMHFGELDSIRAELEPLLTANSFVSDQNAEPLAWALYESFLRILRMSH